MLTLADVIKNDAQYDMGIILEKMCPKCDDEFKVGDYVCWGMCFKCAKLAGLLPKFLS